jgi:2-hydroxy-3-keto-5-methylthiopentenyl-1-phosphate phosphatase
MRVKRDGDRTVPIAGQGGAVVLDFDGTITEEDMLDLVCRSFGDPDVYAEVDAALARGDIRLVDDIERKLVTVGRPQAEVVEWVRRRARIRPGFDDLVETAERAGRRVVVVTSSVRELVEPVLGEHARRVEIVAGSIEPGWRANLGHLAQCDACGEPCKRGAVAGLGTADWVYVGDGWSDRCVALIAPRVFARDGLARYLDEQDVAYEPFADLHDVARGIDAERAAA